MSFGRSWGGGAWSSGVRALPSEERGFVIPDGLGGSRRNYVVRSQTRTPWALGAWGGRGTPVIRTAAGLTFPNPDLATMEIVAWWAYASQIGLTRVHPDGTRVPVRGQPKTVTGITRRNDSVNPACSGEAPLAGWNPGPDTAPPRLITADETGSSFPAGCDAAARFTVPARGSVSFTLPVLATGVPRIESFALRVGAAARPLRPSPQLHPSPQLYPSTPVRAVLRTAWFDAGGLFVRDTTVTLDESLITRSPMLGWQRAVAALEPPPGADTGITTVTIDGAAGGAVVDVTAHLSEVGTTVRPFFDGAAVGGNWIGDAGASPSTLAPTIRLVDGECPLDVQVSYELSNPDLPGVRILTDSVVLDSRGTSWMTDPLDPERPFPVHVIADPERTYALDVQSFTVAGRYRPVVRTEALRHGPTGDLAFATTSQAQHTALMARLASPLPKLMRLPARTRWEPNVWVRLGPLVETNPVHWGAFPVRTLKAPFIEVDRPVAAYSGGA